MKAAISIPIVQTVQTDVLATPNNQQPNGAPPPPLASRSSDTEDLSNISAKIVEPTKTQFNRQTCQTSQTPMQSQSVASISDDNLRAKIRQIRRMKGMRCMKKMKLQDDNLRARIQTIRHMKEMKLKENHTVHTVVKIHVGRVAKHRKNKNKKNQNKDNAEKNAAKRNALIAPTTTETEAPILALATALSTEQGKLFYR